MSAVQAFFRSVAPSASAKIERDVLVAALKLALPYVERVAATRPTEPERQRRQRQADADAHAIRELIARVERT